jgi:uncharacterized protein (DUF885 family)
MHRLTLLVLFGTTCACTPPPPTVAQIADTYLERYFEMYPSRASAEGRADHDARLELPTDERVREWVLYQEDVTSALRAALARPGATPDDELDAEAILHQAARERHQYVVLRRHETDPLFWTSLAANATIFHVVREHRPLAERITDAVARVDQIPALAAEATRRITDAPGDRLSAEICRLAAGQAQSAAVFYRTGFTSFTADGGVDASASATRAADALATLGNALDAASLRATGSPRLGRHYEQTLQTGLATDRRPEDILASAERDLVDLRQEAAAYGRSVWRTVMGSRPMPPGNAGVLRALFNRVSDDRDEDLATYVAHWKDTLTELEAFVRSRQVMTLPEPLRLVVTASPSYLLGQSVGGVYSPGPYAPDAPTLLFLPVPRDDATPQQRTAFFREFNRHFTRMIAPHELLPGHSVQAGYAARHPHKVRTVFADPTYVEGWGTFCERLLLDQGWGGPLPRLAHLKKQLENVARTIVDIRVHTAGMSRDDVLRFVRQEALQEDQFASNMWTRAITASPQMLTYHRGDRDVREVYDAARRAAGDSFDLRAFMDGMMTLGPVPVRHYRARFTR